MSKVSVQYQLPKAAASFTSVSVPHPIPGPEEICIRTKAIGLNPLDWKSHDYGVMVQSWPTVLGIDAAGVVDSVGSSVQTFHPGEEVFNLCGGSTRAGAYQEIVTVPSHQVAKKPASLTFEEAASLPVCYLTAAAAIHNGLDIGLPHIDASGGESSSLKSVLILGGSSAVGAAAIQLLRLALPAVTLLVTSSVQHHAQLVSLGASKCFERSIQDDPSTIKAATPGGSGVDAILDPVEAAAAQPAVFNALYDAGPKVYSFVVGGQNPRAPEGVKPTPVFARDIFNVKGGMDAMSALATLLQDGRYKLPVRMEVVGKGFESIEEGLEKVKGASGTKYVVRL
ncbi:MAG: putative secondary metabolism biosynthetic enzyme [Alyxoria varia]|nr:MAG: putative secondary metabolism biosynthetic enzyme [Alyxoria varia]